MKDLIRPSFLPKVPKTNLSLISQSSLNFTNILLAVIRPSTSSWCSRTSIVQKRTEATTWLRTNGPSTQSRKRTAWGSARWRQLITASRAASSSFLVERPGQPVDEHHEHVGCCRRPGPQAEVRRDAGGTRGMARRAARPPSARPHPPKQTPRRRTTRGKRPARYAPPAASDEDDEPRDPDPAPPAGPAPGEVDNSSAPSTASEATPPVQATSAPVRDFGSDSLSPNPSDHRPDDHLRLDTPELRRGLSTQLARMEDTLRDARELVEAQRQVPRLRELRSLLESEQGEDTDYVLTDGHLFWHAPRGREYAIAAPKQLVPAVLAIIHGTSWHPGAARTTISIETRYRPLLQVPATETRVEQAASGDTRPASTAVGGPRDGSTRHEGDFGSYLSWSTGRPKFLGDLPLPSKETVGLSRKLLELLLTFGLPLSIRCHPGGEFTSQVMQHRRR